MPPSHSAIAAPKPIAPAPNTIPEAVVEPRAGGRFDVCMQAPDGTRHWMCSKITAIQPRARLEMESEVRDDAGVLLFVASRIVRAQVIANVSRQAPGEAVLDGDGRILRGKCDCPYHREAGLRRGPCRHLQALRRLALGERPEPKTLESWFDWLWN